MRHRFDYAQRLVYFLPGNIDTDRNHRKIMHVILLITIILIL